MCERDGRLNNARRRRTRSGRLERDSHTAREAETGSGRGRLSRALHTLNTTHVNRSRLAGAAAHRVPKQTERADRGAVPVHGPHTPSRSHALGQIKNNVQGSDVSKNHCFVLVFRRNKLVRDKHEHKIVKNRHAETFTVNPACLPLCCRGLRGRFGSFRSHLCCHNWTRQMERFPSP